jgi:hypothetical protein
MNHIQELIHIWPLILIWSISIIIIGFCKDNK